MNTEQGSSVSAHPETSALVNRILRRHAALSLRVGLVFVVVLVSVPLINVFAPELGDSKVLGMPITWLFLGILFFPLTWVMSAYFVRESERLDAAIIKDEAKL